MNYSMYNIIVNFSKNLDKSNFFAVSNFYTVIQIIKQEAKSSFSRRKALKGRILFFGLGSQLILGLIFTFHVRIFLKRLSVWVEKNRLTT